MNLIFDFATIIDWILRVVGILSLIKLLCKFIFDKRKWDDTLKIKRVFNSEKYLNNYKRIYPYGEDSEETTIIESNIFPIKRINIYKIKCKNGKINKDKLLYSHRDLLPGEALFLNKCYSCGIPNCIVEIVSYDYGKALVELQENGINGNVNFEKGIEYNYSIWSKIYNLFFN